MDDVIDLLQIKIERAKENLPDETSNAIAAVDWKEAILGMREKKGYNFEQLGDLELETELLLCGLLSPKDYPKELERRMRISKADADELVSEMNELVFKKIREELIKNAERKKIFQKKSAEKEAPAPVNLPVVDNSVLQSSGIEVVKETGINGGNNINTNGVEKREDILAKVENPEGAVHPILQQKILGPFQMPVVKTEYSLKNLSSKKTEAEAPTNNNIPKADPYRELPE